MKAISIVLGFLTYWLVEKAEGEGSGEIVLGLDWLWTRILLKVDLEAWIKLFEGWRGGNSGLRTWKKFDVCIGKVRWIFRNFQIISYEALVFLNDERNLGLTGVPIRIKKDPYPAKAPK